jgi:hypothetical protein
MSTHTKEQVLRVHHLTNLGGLIALAGLDLEPPGLLLGALLQIANGLSNCSAEQRQALASSGHKKLGERASGKRAWKSWARAQELQSINLSPEREMLAARDRVRSPREVRSERTEVDWAIKRRAGLHRVISYYGDWSVLREREQAELAQELRRVKTLDNVGTCNAARLTNLGTSPRLGKRVSPDAARKGHPEVARRRSWPRARGGTWLSNAPIVRAHFLKQFKESTIALGRGNIFGSKYATALHPLDKFVPTAPSIGEGRRRPSAVADGKPRPFSTRLPRVARPAKPLSP